MVGWRTSVLLKRKGVVAWKESLMVAGGMSRRKGGGVKLSHWNSLNYYCLYTNVHCRTKWYCDPNINFNNLELLLQTFCRNMPKCVSQFF